MPTNGLTRRSDIRFSRVLEFSNRRPYSKVSPKIRSQAHAQEDSERGTPKVRSRSRSSVSGLSNPDTGVAPSYLDPTIGPSLKAKVPRRVSNRGMVTTIPMPTIYKASSCWPSFGRLSTRRPPLSHRDSIGGASDAQTAQTLHSTADDSCTNAPPHPYTRPLTPFVSAFTLQRGGKTWHTRLGPKNRRSPGHLPQALFLPFQ